jgi:hypothetical protein
VSGRASRGALFALGAAIAIVTGVALATPVPVLAVSDGHREITGTLAEGEALTYSYRQSIYDVPVFEEFVRQGDVIALLRVRSPDIRSIEYFRWDGDIRQDDDGLWAEEAPPSDHAELTIRLAPLGQQRIATSRWAMDLLPQFGETVITVAVTQRPRAVAWVEAVR